MGCEKTHTTTSISSSLDSTKIRNEYLKKPPLVKHLQNINQFIDAETIDYLYMVDFQFSQMREIESYNQKIDAFKRKHFMDSILKKYNIEIGNRSYPLISSYKSSSKNILIYVFNYILKNPNKNDIYYNEGKMNEVFVIFTIKKNIIKDILILNLNPDRLHEYPLESEVSYCLKDQEKKYRDKSDSINIYTILPISYYHYQKIIQDNNKDFFYSKFRIKNLYYKIYPNGNISTKIYEFPSS
ncbi:MAG: hypothetical protein EAY69_07380 [Cytophagales bacterium]|nr:MAG: hypothetical protein EAY69_07380 [Cytophagales bacterium]